MNNRRGDAFRHLLFLIIRKLITCNRRLFYFNADWLDLVDQPHV